MTKWIERYRQQAEERFQRLDAVLARLQGEEPIDVPSDVPIDRDEGAAS